jgi:hypothetical protein
LFEPIVLYEGKILDGRHRYQACVDTGTEPRFREEVRKRAWADAGYRRIESRNVGYTTVSVCVPPTRDSLCCRPQGRRV